MSAPAISTRPFGCTTFWTDRRSAIRCALLQEVPILGGTFFQVQISEHSAIKRKLVYLFLRIPRLNLLQNHTALAVTKLFSSRYSTRRAALQGPSASASALATVNIDYWKKIAI